MSMDQLIEHINREIKSAISIPKDDRVLDYTTSYSLTTFIKDQFKSSINKNNHYISKPKDISQDLQKIKEFFFTYNLYLPNIISLDTYKLSLGANQQIQIRNNNNNNNTHNNYRNLKDFPLNRIIIGQKDLIKLIEKKQKIWSDNKEIPKNILFNPAELDKSKVINE